MPADLRLEFELTAAVDGVMRRVGIDGRPTVIPATGGAVDDIEIAIPASGSVTIWNSTISPAATFGTLILVPTGNVLLEFWAQTSSDNSHLIAAAGLPFLLFSGGSAAYSTMSFGGSLEPLTKILAKNLTVAQITVRCLIIGAPAGGLPGT
jgi:hypothetical protein